MRGSADRVPTIPPQENQPRPTWRFSGVDRGGPFRWPKDTIDELAILQKLHEFDSMNWSEIEGGKHHTIEVGKLSKAARARLAEIRRDDAPALFSFRCNGKERIFGIRLGGVVHLLWWDPQHAVCPAPLKGT